MKRPESDVAGGASRAARLFQQVDATPLVLFRIGFGAIAVWEVYRYFSKGWIQAYYVKPKFHFTYYGFEWVRPWPGRGMELHFALLGVCAALMTLGLWYRLASILFAFGFTYVFLLEETRYLNHFYLLSVLSFLMAVVPANRTLALDARLRPSMASGTVPAWALVLLTAQVSIAYFFGGVAKINGDWLRGEPMRKWVAREEDFPIIGRWMGEEWMTWIFVYGGLLFDLLVAPCLLWRRSLPFALPAVFSFHLLNDRLFRIGIFPWFMMAATVLYLPPSWLRLGGRFGQAIPAGAPPTTLTPAQRTIAGLVGVHLALQCLVPLRHHLYPGNVSWTEEGHRFSWHMKLRTKRGSATFHVTDPASGRSWTIEPKRFLTRRQVGKMAVHPDMILQFAHYLAREFRDAGYPNVEVRATVMASLNGRPDRPLIDPDVDLAKEPRSLRLNSWIVPLDEPLPSRKDPRAARKVRAAVENAETAVEGSLL
ncbi:MAG: HTTM domain-containing protein [Chloroflexia bacterium]|nr:HTTM domain-containing protein [Chloroflexia bacterium]